MDWDKMESNNNIASLGVLDHGNDPKKIAAFLVKHAGAKYKDGILYLQDMSDVDLRPELTAALKEWEAGKKARSASSPSAS